MRRRLWFYGLFVAGMVAYVLWTTSMPGSSYEEPSPPSDAPGSQRYPWPVGFLYPDRGNWSYESLARVVLGLQAVVADLAG